MEALSAAGVCIGNWVKQHKRVLGTRRLVGPGLVLQTATIRALNQQLAFHATTSFAHIRVVRQFFAEVIESCLSDMIYPIMDANPILLGCTLHLLNADTDAPGCASVKDGSNARVEEKEAFRVVRLVHGARQQHTPHWCTTRAVVSETGAPRASASNKLARLSTTKLVCRKLPKHLRPRARTSLWCCQLL